MIKEEPFFSRSYNLITIIALISGLALTLTGLSNFTWPASLPWSGTDTLLRFVKFLVLGAVSIGILSRWLGWNTGLAYAIIVALLAVCAGAVWPLLVTLLLACASYALGHGIFSKLKLDTANWLNCLLAGAGIYATFVGLLAHFPINYPGIYGLALALPIVFGWRALIEQAMKFRVNVTTTNGGMALTALDVIIAVIALVYFIVALMPEVGFDSLAMHLFVPAHMALRHHWSFDASMYVWAVMPMLGDWLFSIGYMLAGETAVRLVNVGFIFILGWLLRDIVLWAGGSAIGARWAVLLFLSTPLTFAEGSSLYIESVWTSFVIAGVFAIFRACSSTVRPKQELIVAGFMLGCASAAKAATFMMLPALVLLLALRHKSWLKIVGLKLILLGICLFGVLGIIPYATAWKLTGNPVFPLYNKIFQSPFYVTSENFYNPLYSGGNTWDVIYRMTFDSGKYLEATAGAPGFQWLLLFIPALLILIISKQFRPILLIAVGILAFVITFHSQSYLRYVFPSSILLVAAIGVALSKERQPGKFIKSIWIGAASIAVAFNLLFFTAASFYRDFSLISAADKSIRDEYLLTRLPIRNAVELTNHLNFGGKPVAVFAEPLTAGISADALYPNWYNFAFQREIASTQTEQQMADILLKRDVNYVILDRNWNGVNCCGDGAIKQEFVEKVTEKIADFGQFSVRKLKTAYRFNTELLINPDFKSIEGWSLVAGAKYDPATTVIRASVNSPAVQRINVCGGLYLNTVVARCAEKPALGRIQINWMDSRGQFITADIKTFTCTPDWFAQSMEVNAPINANSAEVYVSGHTPVPLEFKSNSLRQ